MQIPPPPTEIIVVVVKGISTILTRSAIDHAVTTDTVHKRYVTELAYIWVDAVVEGIKGGVTTVTRCGGGVAFVAVRHDKVTERAFGLISQCVSWLTSYAAIKVAITVLTVWKLCAT